MSKKHVLVIVDKREGTASRKNDATDLMTLWEQEPNVIYQLAAYPLDIGDIWISVSEDGPFHIPLEWQFSKSTAEHPPLAMDDFFQMPALDQCAVPATPASAFPPPAEIVIERKALADLKASYGDGRYKDQKMRLINCDSKLVVLLVEGYNGSRVKDPR